jgi:two-component system alkaline phosphatase synthesis response regulator PhoP
MRILIAEDERTLANTIATVLRASFPAEVDVALDGADARRLAETNTYEFALVDFWLPPPTGLELVSIWRKSGSTCPVLMMSGGDGKSCLDDALAAGACGCLEKPFSLTTLIEEAKIVIDSTPNTGPKHE